MPLLVLQSTCLHCMSSALAAALCTSACPVCYGVLHMTKYGWFLQVRSVQATGNGMPEPMVEIQLAPGQQRPLVLLPAGQPAMRILDEEGKEYSWEGGPCPAKCITLRLLGQDSASACGSTPCHATLGSKVSCKHLLTCCCVRVQQPYRSCVC